MSKYIGATAVNLSTTSADVTGNATIGGNLTVQGTTITIDSATAQTVDLGDGDKIRMGDGDDLQLYHDGSNSYISESGTGDLNITSNSNLSFDVAGYVILDTDNGNIYLNDDGTGFGQISGASQNLTFKSSASDKDIIFQGNDGGSAITALTLDMSDAGTAIFNSTVTADGLTIDNSGQSQSLVSVGGGSTNAALSLRGSTGSAYAWQISSNAHVASALEFTRSSAVGNTTFSTPSMVIDSAGFVGIGDTPSQKLHVTGGGASPQLRLTGSSGDIDFYSYTDGALYINNANGTALGLLANKDAYFNNNVGIGLSTPSSQYAKNLNIRTTTNTGGAALHITDGITGSGNSDGFHLVVSGGIPYIWNREDSNMVFATNNTARMTLNNKGHLSIPNVADVVISNKGCLRAGNADHIFGAASGSGVTSTSFLGVGHYFAQGFASGQYIHLKTNHVMGTGGGEYSMILVEYIGYQYSPANTIHTLAGMHPYDGAVYNVSTKDNGSFTGLHVNEYKSSDGHLVLVLNAKTTSAAAYIGVTINIYNTHTGYTVQTKTQHSQDGAFKFTAATNTTSPSGAY